MLEMQIFNKYIISQLKVECEKLGKFSYKYTNKIDFVSQFISLYGRDLYDFIFF